MKKEEMLIMKQMEEIEQLRNKYIDEAKKVDKQKQVLDKIKKYNKRIIDYGFDYDGFNNVEDLKKLIDMLVDYAKQNDELLEEIE